MAARWKTDEKGPYIRVMPTGRKSYLLDATPENYDIGEIAYHAAGINRYTGGSRFSIAQHMVVGAMLAERFYPEDQLLSHRFLIHDIAETKLGDVSSPLKSILGASYKDLEARHDLAVEEKFGVTFLGVPSVKELDDRMWLTERLWIYRDVPPDMKAELEDDVVNVPLEPFPLDREDMEYYFKPWGPEKAEAVYLISLALKFGVRREGN